MWYNILIVTVLVLLAGSFAGLTLALFSIRITTLERKMKLGDKKAEKVYKIRKRGNLLLCTLLLGNVASYTVMSIFLGSITSGVIASFIATALIFVFGEILPQAIFPRFALEIGSRLSWLVWILLIIFYPISAPLAWILDKLLGEEPPVLWSKEELQEIIKFHEDVGDGIIDQDEERIILGALSFSEKNVAGVMIPRDHVFYLENEQVVDEAVMEQIREKGFSRIPVIDSVHQQAKGILYAKNLIGMEHAGKNALDLCSPSNLITVAHDINLDNLMNLFINRKIQMAVVNDSNGNFAGVATLEDVMEEILKTEIEENKG